MHEFLRDLRFGIRLLAKPGSHCDRRALIGCRHRREYADLQCGGRSAASAASGFASGEPSAAVVFLVGLIALLATAPAAIRAARTDPGSALRT
jgi:hypothetical protein